jgi:hypothetical protein
VEAQRAQAAIASATPAQVELMRSLASRSPNGIKIVPNAAWVEHFMVATKDLTSEQVAHLEQVEWEPAPDLTLEQMQQRLQAALVGGTPAKEGTEQQDVMTKDVGVTQPETPTTSVASSREDGAQVAELLAKYTSLEAGQFYVAPQKEGPIKAPTTRAALIVGRRPADRQLAGVLADVEILQPEGPGRWRIRVRPGAMVYDADGRPQGKWTLSDSFVVKEIR